MKVKIHIPIHHYVEIFMEVPDGLDDPGVDDFVAAHLPAYEAQILNSPSVSSQIDWWDWDIVDEQE